MLIGIHKSGSIGDNCDGIVISHAIYRKYSDASLVYLTDCRSVLSLLKQVPWLTAVQLVDYSLLGAVERDGWKYDLFFDCRPYVGKVYRGYEQFQRGAVVVESQDDQEMAYQHPLSHYTNLLSMERRSHLEIACESMGLPAPDWDAARLHVNPVKRDGKWCTIAPHCAGKAQGVLQTKVWSDSKWRDLVEMLKLDDWAVYQVGSKKETLIRGAIDARTKSLRDGLSWLAGSPLHIAIENGTVRMRRLVTDKPSVVLYGPTDAVMYGLPGNVVVSADVCRPCFWLTSDWMVKCPKHEKPQRFWQKVFAPEPAWCMDNIKASDVMEAINAF